MHSTRETQFADYPGIYGKKDAGDSFSSFHVSFIMNLGQVSKILPMTIDFLVLSVPNRSNNIVNEVYANKNYVTLNGKGGYLRHTDYGMLLGSLL
ncbi:hypothetical protein ACJX0J_018313, partial [Zea mays]